MNQKVVALQALRAVMVNGERLVQDHYIKQVEGTTCYCAVGFLMKECGIDLEPLLEEENEGINDALINSAILDDYSTKMEQFGFTLEELNRMQILNDEQNYEELTEYIDKLLEPSV